MVISLLFFLCWKDSFVWNIPKDEACHKHFFPTRHLHLVKSAAFAGGRDEK